MKILVAHNLYQQPGGEDIVVLFAREDPGLEVADGDFFEPPHQGALAEDDHFMAERRDRLGELQRCASFFVIVKAAFQPVPAREEGNFQGTHGLLRLYTNLHDIDFADAEALAEGHDFLA